MTDIVSDKMSKVLDDALVASLDVSPADEIQSLRQRVERLEGALRFYADLDDWEDFRADEAASAFDRDTGSKLGDDMGKTARAALGGRNG